MILSEYVKQFKPDTEVSVAMKNSLWLDDCEYMYHSSYLGNINGIPDKYMNCEVVKTFTAFMWGTHTIIIDGLSE